MMMHSPGTFWSAGTQNATDLLPPYEEPNGFGVNGIQRLCADMIGKENHNRMNNPNNLKQKLYDYVMEERNTLNAFGKLSFCILRWDTGHTGPTANYRKPFLA